MSAEGESRDWAAAAGTGQGVVGGFSSVKGQGSGKRRMESGKNSEKKKRRLSKGKEKNVDEETESHAGIIDLNTSAEFPKDDSKVDACDEVETSAAAALRNCSQTLPGTRNGSGDVTIENGARHPDGYVVAKASEMDTHNMQHNGTSDGPPGRLSDAFGSQGSLLLRPGERTPDELTQVGCVPLETGGQVLVGETRKVTFRDPMYEFASNHGELSSQEDKEGHSDSAFMECVSRSASGAQPSASPD